MRCVLVTQRVVLDSHTGEFRDCLDSRWGPYLMRLGLVPIPVPSGVEVKPWVAAVGPIAGLLLTGGNDLVEVDSSEPNQRRERLERDLLGLLEGTPTLGVCRGMQLLASLDGYSLSPVDGHVRTRHRLEVPSGSRWFSEAGGREVNSFHRYAVVGTGRRLAVEATAYGSIEAFSDPSRQVVGVMWHPEREATPHPADDKLFKEVFG